MSNLYKIECANALYASDIAIYIEKQNGKFVMWGGAIITNYCFNDDAWIESAIGIISRVTDNVTDEDKNLFYAAHPEEYKQEPKQGEWWLCKLRDGEEKELYCDAFWWATEPDGDKIDPLFDGCMPIKKLDL